MTFFFFFYLCFIKTLFSDFTLLQPKERVELLEVMNERIYMSGERIITQGEKGNEFFVWL